MELNQVSFKGAGGEKVIFSHMQMLERLFPTVDFQFTWKVLLSFDGKNRPIVFVLWHHIFN